MYLGTLVTKPLADAQRFLAWHHSCIRGEKVLCVCRGEVLAETPERYCRNCGHQLSPEDQFCPNCARPVHETATVPTPEADVPVPPPPQTTGGAGGAAAPQQPAQEGGGGRRRRPILVGSLGVFVLLVAASSRSSSALCTGKGFSAVMRPRQSRKAPRARSGRRSNSATWRGRSRQRGELQN
jgi:hypothetical protein